MILAETLPSSMHGVQLVGHGGFDKLVYREDLPVPLPNVGDVLIQVAAAGVNNTDINTRIGWYSKSGTPFRRLSSSVFGWNASTCCYRFGIGW